MESPVKVRQAADRRAATLSHPGASGIILRMKLPPFKLDHWLAAHEFADPPIRYNLASSTGPMWTLGELMGLGGGELSQLADVRLSYAPPQGGKLLRDRIGALCGADPDHVVVTTGASEALIALVCHFAQPGASIVLPQPCYPAVPVLARAWGMNVRQYHLDAARGFAQTAAGVLEAVDGSTRVVFVNTPHNPTGSVMSAAEQRKLAEALQSCGIALVVDEVYHPLYFREPVASATSLPGTIVLGDFAKALSVPGLRIGWVIDGDARRREALVDARSYFTISNSPLTEVIAGHALGHSAAILGRLRDVAQANLALLTDFMGRHRERIDFTPPAGGTTCFPRLADGRDTRPLCESLARAGVLVAPGDCFDMPAHLRLGFGAQREGYAQALELFGQVLERDSTGVPTPVPTPGA
jgi:aspartate/methionine/tyrosine aminotransferase